MEIVSVSGLAELVVISKTGGKTVYQRPIQTLIPFKITTDNHEPSDHKPVNDSKKANKTHILNSRRPTRKAKEKGQYLRELQDRYGWLFVSQGEC